MIETTVEDLENHLQSTVENLENIIMHFQDSNTGRRGSSAYGVDECLSTQKCLEICTQFSGHIDKIQQLQKGHDNSWILSGA